MRAGFSGPPLALVAARMTWVRKDRESLPRPSRLRTRPGLGRKSKGSSYTMPGRLRRRTVGSSSNHATSQYCAEKLALFGEARLAPSQHGRCEGCRNPTCRQSIRPGRGGARIACFNLAVLIGRSPRAFYAFFSSSSPVVDPTPDCDGARHAAPITRWRHLVVHAVLRAHPASQASGTSRRRDRGAHTFTHARSRADLTRLAGKISCSPHPLRSTKHRPPDGGARINPRNVAASVRCHDLSVAAPAG